MHGFFVTGTGTEVGKSVVAAVLAHTAVADGVRVNVFKPAMSGLEEEGEPDHELLRRASRSGQSDDEIAPYRFDPPLSPHLAAQQAGVEISRERLVDAARGAATGADLLIAEGVGGFLVPLRLDYLVRDFAHDLGLPVVIAASPELGTINHTLLTIEAVRGAGLQVAAVVLTPWPVPATTLAASNRDSIAALADVDVLELPEIDLTAPESWPELRPFGPL